MYQGTVFNVLIASPSDVPKERHVAKEVVHAWNSDHAEDERIILQPLLWETDSYPQAGGSPQELLNRGIVNKADLLIGIFWTRLGTPTANATSGTVEEITKHVNAGKPAMIYFSSAPVVPDSVDSEQYKLLKAYKNELSSRALYSGYSSIDEFRTKLQSNVRQAVVNDEYFSQHRRALGVGDSNPQSEAPSLEVPTLRPEAKELLLEAVKDPNGEILNISSIGGRSISANKRNFIMSEEPRERARWEEALIEIEDKRLISSPNSKRQIFRVTNLGYSIADKLGAT